MMETAKGIVLRTRQLTETSLIVHWLTQEVGRIATVAKGASRAKSPFRGKLDLFYVAEFSFRRSRHSELHTLSEVTLLDTHLPIRQDVFRLQQGCYCVELLELATETETPIAGHYDWVMGFLRHLTVVGADTKNVLALELKLLMESGLMPDLQASRLSDGAAKAALILAERPWEFIANLRLTRGQELELARFLAAHWQSELPRAPRSRDAALGLSPGPG